MKQRYLDLSDDPFIYDKAIMDCFKQKWNRSDVLAYVEKFSGVDRESIYLDEDGSVRLEAINGCSKALQEMIDNILKEDFDAIDIVPPRVRQRPDGMTGKMRDIALLCIPHQLIEHVTFNLLKPLFKAKLFDTQHASIHGRGQTGLKKQIAKYLRSDLPITYYCKTDMRHAYASVQYSVVIKELRKDIPSATHIFKLLEYLGALAPGGHLIIGGYLDAWLFNYMMSKVLAHIYTLGQTRRGKFTRYIVRAVTYMDDMALFSSSIKGLKIALKSAEKFAAEELGMELKISTGIVKLLSIEEERARGKVCPFVDMAGYRVYRSRITMRRRVYIRARRQFIRAWKEYQETKTINIQRAYKLISYNGFLKQSDSYRFREKYHTDKLVAIARKVISVHSRIENRKNKEKKNDLKRRRIEREAI